MDNNYQGANNPQCPNNYQGTAKYHDLQSKIDALNLELSKLPSTPVSQARANEIKIKLEQLRGEQYAEQRYPNNDPRYLNNDPRNPNVDWRNPNVA